MLAAAARSFASLIEAGSSLRFHSGLAPLRFLPPPLSQEEEGTSAGALAGSLRRSSFGGGAGSVPGGPCAAPSAQFSSRDLEFIARFSTETAGDTFRLLVNSLCPAIYGHELVKARTEPHAI